MFALAVRDMHTWISFNRDVLGSRSLALHYRGCRHSADPEEEEEVEEEDMEEKDEQVEEVGEGEEEEGDALFGGVWLPSWVLLGPS